MVAMSKFTDYQDWCEQCTEKGALRFQPAGENVYATTADSELVGTWSFVTHKGEVFDD